ncbi:SoxR reducing system RseC family protein [Arhodomonas aquaeolei]|uniref:SoxR reducing system RseC family protein n=1 Tax=Arhodomonas aquaeolei TaxID=2369 RepID=UPI0003822623|nr:SoxR reducing system RseC family protein [Arhodomonas aquaeolei]
MIREPVRVVAVEPGAIRVRGEPGAVCHGCAAHGGCGVRSLATYLAGRTRALRIATRRPTEVGERLMIGVEEGALVGASVAAYLVPLVLMIAAAIAGRTAALGLELPADAGALAGMASALGLWWWLGPLTRMPIPGIRLLGEAPSPDAETARGGTVEGV